MTINEDDRKINKVAILGAGASADAGAPVLSNFFDKVNELISLSKFTEEEIKIFNDVLSKRKILLPNSNIEEFFSYVDFQNHFDVLLSTPSSFRRIQRRVFNKNIPNSIPICPDLQQIGFEKQDFAKLKSDISFLISRTLDETLKDTNREIIKAYQKVLETFDVIISFNWDILCEYSYHDLCHKSLSNEQLGFNKSLMIKPTLLKLHGSFNWGLCNNCGLNIFDSKIEHKIYGDKIRCLKCNEKLLPVSILPVLTKLEKIANINSPPYKNMWHCAMQSITESKEIYFFGYSLSENDIHTKIFLKSGILNNINSDLKVIVVDKYCDKYLKRRYNNAFEGKTVPKFIKLSFKDYFSNSSSKSI